MPGRSRLSRPATLVALACGSAIAVGACGTTVPQTTTYSPSGVGGPTTGLEPLDQSRSASAGTLAGSAGDPAVGSPTDSGSATAAGSAAGGANGSVQGGSSQPAPVAEGQPTTAGGPHRANPGTSGGSGKGTNPTGRGPSPKPGAATSSGTTSKSGATAAGLPVGVTATQINVGIPYAPGAGAQLSSLGFGNLDAGNTLSYYQAVIDDVNAHGGVLGKQLNPVVHTYSSSSTGTQAQADAEVCSDLTQDHHIYAGLSLGGDDQQRTCFTQGGVAGLVNENLTFSDASVFQRYSAYVEPSTLSYDRSERTEVPSLLRQGYFSGWNTATGQPSTLTKAKVGVIASMATGVQKAVNGSLLPALKAAGYPVDPADDEQIVLPQSSSDDAVFASQVSAAVLKFASDGITHVYIEDYSAGITAVFLARAQSQQYFPRYALNTESGAQVLLSGSEIMTSQLNGAMGIGWFPELDVQASDNSETGPYSNAALRGCLAIYAAKGITFANANAASTALTLCDNVHFLVAALKASGDSAITEQTFEKGIQNLGTTFVDAVTLGEKIDPTHRDGVNAVSDWSYMSSCTCFRYSGDAYAPSAS